MNTESAAKSRSRRVRLDAVGSDGDRSRPTVLRRIKHIEGLTVGASDGKVVDCFFDDHSWTVRYLVVDTGGWLRGRRRVLLLPAAVRAIAARDNRLVTDLTRQEIEQSPDVDTDRPVSRQQEIDPHHHYGFPYYWTGPFRWGITPTPWAAAIAGVPLAPVTPQRERHDDPHLRSAREITGYGIHASDGDLGHVVDFLVEDDSWAIRYLIVDPRTFWPARHVLIATDWIRWVAWGERRLHVDLTCEEIRRAAPYDPSSVVD